MKIRKKLTALLLTCVMVITLCPMAFATSQSSYDSEVAGAVSQRASILLVERVH